MRTLSPLEKSIRKKYTQIIGYGKSRSVLLSIDQQSFYVVQHTTLKRAKWFQNNLAIALTRLLRNEAK